MVILRTRQYFYRLTKQQIGGSTPNVPHRGVSCRVTCSTLFPALSLCNFCSFITRSKTNQKNTQLGTCLVGVSGVTAGFWFVIIGFIHYSLSPVCREFFFLRFESREKSRRARTSRISRPRWMTLMSSTLNVKSRSFVHTEGSPRVIQPLLTQTFHLFSRRMTRRP